MRQDKSPRLIRSRVRSDPDVSASDRITKVDLSNELAEIEVAGRGSVVDICLEVEKPGLSEDEECIAV